MKALKWLMGTFSEEGVWRRLRCLDVDINRRAFQIQTFVDMGHLLREKISSLCLGEMKELTLVTMRVMIRKEDQWKTRRNHHWRPWKKTGKIKILKELLNSLEEGSGVKFGMQYI